MTRFHCSEATPFSDSPKCASPGDAQPCDCYSKRSVSRSSLSPSICCSAVRTMILATSDPARRAAIVDRSESTLGWEVRARSVRSGCRCRRRSRACERAISRTRTSLGHLGKIVTAVAGLLGSGQPPKRKRSRGGECRHRDRAVRCSPPQSSSNGPANRSTPTVPPRLAASARPTDSICHINSQTLVSRRQLGRRPRLTAVGLVVAGYAGWANMSSARLSIA